jgi:hypothetical protein
MVVKVPWEGVEACARSDNLPALLTRAPLTDKAREVRFERTTRAATP